MTRNDYTKMTRNNVWQLILYNKEITRNSPHGKYNPLLAKMLLFILLLYSRYSS